MSLYNLGRFRFERKRRAAEEETACPWAAQVQAAGCAAAGDAAGGAEDEAPAGSSEPGAAPSGVTHRAGDSAIPESPEAKRTRKRSYLKRPRGVRFPDSSSGSKDEEPRNFIAAKEDKAPRREAAVISDDDDDEQPEVELPQFAYVNGGHQLPAVKKSVEEVIRDAKLQKLKELFPQRSDQELLQFIESTCTIEEAIDAALKFDDKAASRKKKLKGSPTNCKTRNKQLAKKPKADYVSLESIPWPEASGSSRSDKSEMKLKQKSARKEQKGFWKKDKGKRSIWSTNRETADSEDESASEGDGSSLDKDYSSGNGVVEDGYKAKILAFLQDASPSELALIPQCSEKKAQKIIALRPFNSWEALISQEDGFIARKKSLGESWLGDEIFILRRVSDDKLAVILELKPYQKIALNWLALLHEHRVNGILADEMGLGKTVEAIAFLAYLYQKGNRGPHLIVVPASTLDNWVREVHLWCPHLNVLVYHGSQEDRKDLREDIINEVVDFNVIITTYNCAISSPGDRGLFRRLELNYAIFDEGHVLKNMSSIRYLHLMTINAKNRLLLTGTPVQNNLLELMSLLNFVMPCMFSRSTREVRRMFSSKAKSAEAQSLYEKERIVHAKQIIKPFILRRIKDEVLKQLPPKKYFIELCAMSEKQEQLYCDLLKNVKKTVNSNGMTSLYPPYILGWASHVFYHLSKDWTSLLGNVSSGEEV
ncbi:SWI/SNF-related matrix-associated actin-dependent regulator of chromatin subfamily A containing DEAD/H box 1-like [Nyctibius grandis]|uniref:SWI/SNF-related matrix-associated actin-dependent regulator of chromatin subfamily A containing DEAD/H box 1-like n=1 Tax=Nyctibius grandis TaxID=48427 RepID=UPI0035BC86E7